MVRRAQDWVDGSMAERLFDSNIVGIFVADLEGRVSFANDRFLQMLGYGHGDLPLARAELTPSEHSHMEETKRREVLATGVTAPWEREYIHRDGRRIPVLVGVAHLSPETRDCICFSVDLSAGKQAEHALRVSEARYRALYEDIPLLYCTLDEQGRIQAVNAFGLEALGCTSEELIGRPVQTLFHPDDHTSVNERLTTLLAHPDRIGRWEFRKQRRNGTVLWAQQSARVVPGRDGRPMVLMVCEDITERLDSEGEHREQERRLHALTTELAMAEERERRRIASGLHDQIGQRLAMIKLKLSTLDTRELPVGQAEMLMEVDEDLVHVIEATRSLTFELGSPALTELGFPAAVKALAEHFVGRHGLRLRFEEDQQPKSLNDDTEIILYSAVRELLTNIAKHAQANAVCVAITREDNRIHIVIKDDGRGFPTTGDCVVQTSYQVYGLRSVREHLEHIGGHFEIANAPTVGTRAVLVAPLAAA